MLGRDLRILSRVGVSVETILKLHIIAHPISTAVLLLTEPIITLFAGPRELFTDTFTCVVNVWFAISLLIITGSIVLLSKGVRNGCIWSLKVYMGLYFTIQMINYILYIIRDEVTPNKHRSLGALVTYILLRINLWQHFLDGASMFYYLEKLRRECGLRATEQVVGIAIHKFMNSYLIMNWILTVVEAIRPLQIVLSKWNEHSTEPERFVLRMVHSSLALLGAIVIAILLHKGVREGKPHLLNCTRWLKPAVVFCASIIYIFTRHKWHSTLRETANFKLDPQTKVLPVLATSYLIFDNLLVNLYIQWFVSHDTISPSNTEVEMGRRVLARYMADQKIKRLQVKFIENDGENFLGEGQFGKVLKGTILKHSFKGVNKISEGTTVAVKFLNQEFTSAENMKSFMSELKVLYKISPGHTNLIRFYGVACDNAAGGVGIVMEYCSMGSLENYLRDRRKEHPLIDQVPYESDLRKLRTWAIEIASAVHFLHKLKVIHGDLATRNILIAENGFAKVSDFGLSYRLYYYQLYARSKQSVFPWRWMAPESLSDLKFSSKSDVWSYGVLLWEMYTFGKIPWWPQEWNLHFLDHLKSGGQLQKPPLVSDELYQKVFLRCCCADECSRLDFPAVLRYLREFLPDQPKMIQNDMDIEVLNAL